MEKIEEEIIKTLEPQKKAFRDVMQEINGKTMDYESCRLLEEFFDTYTKQIIHNFIEAIKVLKKEVKK